MSAGFSLARSPVSVEREEGSLAISMLSMDRLAEGLKRSGSLKRKTFLKGEMEKWPMRSEQRGSKRYTVLTVVYGA